MQRLVTYRVSQVEAANKILSKIEQFKESLNAFIHYPFRRDYTCLHNHVKNARRHYAGYTSWVLQNSLKNTQESAWSLQQCTNGRGYDSIWLVSFFGTSFSWPRSHSFLLLQLCLMFENINTFEKCSHRKWRIRVLFLNHSFSIAQKVRGQTLVILLHILYNSKDL